MESFGQRKRDPFLTEELYYEAITRFNELMTDNDFPEDRVILLANRTQSNAKNMSFYRASAMVEIVLRRYSGGEDIKGIREAVINMFEDFNRHCQAFDKVYNLWEADSYYYAMLWLSWAVLFNLPQYVPMAATFINRDPDKGHDPFIHTLFAALGVPNFPGKDTQLLHPDPYEILCEGLRGDRDKQQVSMSVYLKRWYKGEAIKGCYWHDRHKRAPENHFGYWAFETGMLTALNGLDDSSYRDLNFYPRDLVDYGKEQGWHKELIANLRACPNK